MNDLIRRADALREILSGHDDVIYIDKDEAAKRIRSIPVVEPKQGEWIPCSERLPESQGYYICTCKDGPTYRRTTTIKWSNGWQLSGRRAFWTVVAWMPLPEPWRGADDETD